MNKSRTIADAMLEVLRAYGVEYIFSSPGSEWSPVWDALAKAKAAGIAPAFINTRHEELAVSVALGYHFQSRKLPAILLHAGIGTLHAAMALRAASQACVPMVVLAGVSAGFGEMPGPDPGSHWARSLAEVGGPAAVIRPIVKWASTVTSAETLLGMLQDACRLAFTPPLGPVVLAVPQEFMLGVTCPPFDGRCAPPPVSTQPNPSVLEEIARQLVQAKRPLLLTEYAGRDHRNVGLLVEIAESLALPVVEACNPMLLNFPRDHALHQGFDGDPLLREADVVLLAGNQMPWHPPSRRPTNASSVILIDDDPSHLVLPYWGFGVDTVVGGDMYSSLRQLSTLVADMKSKHDGLEGTREERREWYRARHVKQAEQFRAKALALAEKNPIEGAWASQVIGDELPADAIVIEEVVTHSPLVAQHVTRSLPGTYYRERGGLGLGLGSALGFKFAAPDRLVVALIGDGSFNYNPVLAAFGFAQQFAVPILVILMNNQGYAAMKRNQLRHYPDGWAVRTQTFLGSEIEPTPDYRHIVQAFGGYGERVEDPQEVQPAIRRAVECVRGGQLAFLDLILKQDFS